MLAHHQPRDSRRGTGLPADVADLMVQRMVAEQISQNVYRMFPPDSVFSAAKLCPEISNFIPAKLPPREVGGVKFRPPVSALASTVPRSQSLSRRREIYGDLQLAISLLPEQASA